MQPPVDIATLPTTAQRVLDPGAPPALRQMAARGIAPGLKPGDAITVVALLAECPEAAIAELASATLRKLPAPVLNGALSTDLPAGVIDVIAPLYATDLAVMERMLSLPSILMETVATVAARASEAVSELIATNEQRLLLNPVIIEKLYMNRATRMSTADRLIELAVRNKLELPGIPAFREAATAMANELVMVTEPSPEPTFSDILFKDAEELAQKLAESADVLEDTHELDEATGEEKPRPKFVPLHAKMAEMTTTEKIRMAQLGNASERMLLVRDTNKLVASAAIRSPSIQENEVTQIAASRAVSEDVLRIIANSRTWTRSHQIKFNLVCNPRAPFSSVSKFIQHLRENELKTLSKSKNIAQAVVTAVKQQLERKGKGG